MRRTAQIVFTLLTVLIAAHAAEIRAVVPKNAVTLIGPYSLGVFAGDYLYVSGQGAKPPDGQMPADFEGQVRQSLENVKSIVEAAGLTMEHVVYTQVHLTDMSKFTIMNRLYREYFPHTPPARAVLGVVKLPGMTPVEINAVAIRDLADKKAVTVKALDNGEPISAGILTKDRLFLSAARGQGSTVEQQVDSALDGMDAIVEAAGLKMANIVFVNPYLTDGIPMDAMNKLYAKRFEFGNTPARATIKVNSLPEGTRIEFTGVAVRDLSQRVAVRPKNMAPSPTASPCVFAADTLYCSAKSGFIPGINGGIFTPAIDLQLRQTMRNLLDNLEEAGLGFENVVASNVYLDDLSDFSAMNAIYARFFKGILPARTTIQQLPPVERTKRDNDTYPEVEQISLIAIKGATSTKRK